MQNNNLWSIYLPVPSNPWFDHETHIVSKILNSIDPTDNDGLKDGYPKDSDSTSISVHYVKHVLARIGHKWEAAISF